MRQYSTVELKRLQSAIAAELCARETQLAILTDTLERLLESNASDAVIENIVAAIDILDGANLSALAESEDDSADQADEPETPDAKGRVIAELRALGYTAPGLDALVRLYHRDIAEQDYLSAEQDTRGHMVKREYALTYNPRRLWFCNKRELQKYASDEMLTWFDQHGRTTYNLLKDRLLTGGHYAGSGYLNNR